MKSIKKTIYIVFFIYLGLFLFIPDNALAGPTLTPSGGDLPDGMVGTSYSTTVTASGCPRSGTRKYDWRWVGSNRPPPGINASLNSDSTIATFSGTPTLPGSWTFTIRVRGRNCSGPTWTYATYTITVNTNAPVITTTSLPDGILNVSYSATIEAEGGTTPYTWSVDGQSENTNGCSTGEYPLTGSDIGLCLDSSTGIISGTPTTSGDYTFTITVTDSLLATDSKVFTISIAPIGIITTSPLPDGTEGVSYSTTITGAGGSGSYSWSVPPGTLPPGLSLAPTGTPSTTITGVPTSGGTYTFTITLTDGTDFVTKDFTITINPSDLSIDTVTLDPDSVVVCTPYFATITGSGGNTPYSWGITAGSLPSGLSLAPTGTPSTTITGVPTTTGTYSFTVTLTDNIGVMRSESFGITVTGSATDCVPQIEDYTAYPPFVQLSGVKPNVLIALDNSGSMHEFAYKEQEGRGRSRSNAENTYGPGKDYYGYFKSRSDSPTGAPTMYSYSGSYFEEDTAGTWDGDFLNWLTMRRIDVMRKVLVGGKAIPRSQTQINYLIAAENPDRDFWKEYNFQTYRVYPGSSYEIIRVCTDGAGGNCGSGDGPTYNVRVKFGAAGVEPEGLVHDTVNQVRFGLMFFNRGDKFEDGGGSRDGGDVVLKMGTTSTSLVTQIQNTDPSTWTPLGETMYEAVRFYQGGDSAYNGGNYGGAWDPLDEYCQDNFILFLTDGESTKDKNVPGGNWGTPITDPLGFNVKTYMDNIGTNEGYASQWNVGANTMDGTYYLEGVSYYAHTNDIRPDPDGKCPDGDGVYDKECDDQTITTYTVFAFDESPVGQDLLNKAAKYGGFEDFDDDGVPYTDATCGTATPDPGCAEWDKDGDGFADTYFEAKEGKELERKIRQAIEDILKRVSSGTSASVLSTTGEGEGTVYQAYFLPSTTMGPEEVKWIGYMHGLFVDFYGNMREDTNGDNRLCYFPGDIHNPPDCTSADTDKIVVMFFNEETDPQRTQVKRYSGEVYLNDEVYSDGVPKGDYELPYVELDEVNIIWEAGNYLWNTLPSERTIYTTVNGSDFLANGFAETNASTLKPYLRAASDDEATAIIKYIRGEDDPVVNSVTYDYRPRTIEIGADLKVWKLADIVYSTPMAVSKPAESYAQLYKDATYAMFKQKHINRRHVVYVGSSGGMLHAFNGGFYDPAKLKFCDAYDPLEPGVCPDADTGSELGKELWGFIPQSLLPHLVWLTDIDYTHVYYVDLKPKIVDVRIFTPEGACSDDPESINYINNCIHPYGWGTVLIGGMRYGGRDIAFQDASWTEKRTFRSAYFAIDITDPLNPDLLWTIPNTSDTNPDGLPDLGLTTSRPAVLRIGDVSDPGDWYAIFGSGPDAGVDSYDGISERFGTIYIVNLATGALESTFSLAENYSFVGDPITVDVNLTDYAVDAIYIGTTYCESSAICTSSEWRGKMHRITTNLGDLDITSWALETLYDAGQSITAAPSITLDDIGNLWLYFGTGRYYAIEDSFLDGTEYWRFYGIKDRCQSWIDPASALCSTPIVEVDLFDATNVIVYTDESVTGADAGIDTFTLLEQAINDPDNDGWFLDFDTGERSLFKPGVLGGIVAWTTYTPSSSDACALGGTSRLFASFYKTGTAYKRSVIGVEGTGEVKQIKRTQDLGMGVPSSPGFSVTGEKAAKGFIQQSTGAIIQLEAETPFVLKSGITGWRTGECQ